MQLNHKAQKCDRDQHLTESQACLTLGARK